VSTWYVANNIGIDEAETSGFTIYPNPITDMVYFNFDNSQVRVQNIMVTDALGRMVESYPFVMNGQPMMNISSWDNGVYSVSMFDETGIRHTETLIVAH
jgi:hypothetical protein